MHKFYTEEGGLMLEVSLPLPPLSTDVLWCRDHVRQSSLNAMRRGPTVTSMLSDSYEDRRETGKWVRRDPFSSPSNSFQSSLRVHMVWGRTLNGRVSSFIEGSGDLGFRDTSFLDGRDQVLTSLVYPSRRIKTLNQVTKRTQRVLRYWD